DLNNFWKENGKLPLKNEKSGNKATPTLTQSFTFIINKEEKCKDKIPALVLLLSTTTDEFHMRWVASYCSGTRFAMKADSDVFVNMMHLIEKLPRPLPPPTQNYFTGHLMKGHRPIWNKGNGYIFSGDLAAKIVNASLIIKYIHLEDVYIGFCLNVKGVQIVPPPYSLFNLHKVPFSPCVYNKIITSHRIQTREHILYWETLQKKKHVRRERSILEHPRNTFDNGQGSRCFLIRNRTSM
uniref:Hexosyltransferase n=1 Tax=Cyanistes caeruleus TaxID=156563 RepID=A0A8C0ZFS2_CYACU